jgi:hypothetical protein
MTGTRPRKGCAAKHWKAQQTTAYEECLRVLGLINLADPITELLAKQIIGVAQTGVRDPSNIALGYSIADHTELGAERLPATLTSIEAGR